MRSPIIPGFGRAVPMLFAAILGLAVSTPAQSEPVDDETCLECHEGFGKTLASTPHHLADAATGVRCASCHRDTDAHLDDPSPETMRTPAEMAGTDVVAVCTQCHARHDNLDDAGYDAHSIEQLSCADCHRVHGGSIELLVDDGAAFCLRCHETIAAQLTMTSSHPLEGGAVTCLSCHRFAKREDSPVAFDVFAAGSGRCRDCHPEQGGPFPYEHEAVNSYSVEGGACTECHTPHGSQNHHLLRQPGQALCRQCHFPARHTTAHGGIWAKYACQQCHVDTHGSFVSNHYLDPNLPAKFGGDCFNAGCHSLNP